MSQIRRRFVAGFVGKSRMRTWACAGFQDVLRSAALADPPIRRKAGNSLEVVAEVGTSGKMIRRSGSLNSFPAPFVNPVGRGGMKPVATMQIVEDEAGVRDSCRLRLRPGLVFSFCGGPDASAQEKQYFGAFEEISLDKRQRIGFDSVVADSCRFCLRSHR